MKMEIFVSDTSKGKLLSNTSQPFLIINLIGNFFLLTKASRKQTFDKNINFKIQQKEFYSTFIRHINLSYSGKLSELIENLSVMANPELQHEWLMLYQIHDFNTESLKHYKIQVPPYGASVKIHLKSGKYKKSIVSNLFRSNGETFYFLSCNPNCCQEFALITNQSCSIIYGLTYFVKDITVCLPFHSICSEKSCPVSILPEIKPQLLGTCYISYCGNYCTGFVLNEKLVVSARHLLPFEQQKVSVEVGIRFYPYHQQKTGYISRVGQGSVDIIEIIVNDKIISKKQTASLQAGNLIGLKVDQEKYVGKQIMALGFGKFDYSQRIFQKIDTVMPTIQTGVISKLIALGHNNVFLKTDASLYNGFSGCGIWSGFQLIGMAVFILKNRNNQSHFNRHNFSYTLKFIQNLLDKDTKDFLISQINAQLNLFDKIQTRHWIQLLPRL